MPRSVRPPLEIEIQVPPVYARGHRYCVLITAGTDAGYDRVHIFREKSDLQPIAELRKSEISAWQYEMFMDHGGKKRRGRFRFQLIDLSANADTCKLYTWAINTAEPYTVPEELTEELEKEVGPYLEVDDPWAYLDQWVGLGSLYEPAPDPR